MSLWIYHGVTYIITYLKLKEDVKIKFRKGFYQFHLIINILDSVI